MTNLFIYCEDFAVAISLTMYTEKRKLTHYKYNSTMFEYNSYIAGFPLNLVPPLRPEGPEFPPARRILTFRSPRPVPEAEEREPKQAL